MKQKYLYHIFSTYQGFIGLIKNSRGLCGVILPKKTYNAVFNEIHDLYGKNINKVRLNKLELKIRKYLRGHKIQFDQKIDLGSSTDFQKRVLLSTVNIPWGQVRSYSYIAKKAGDAKSVRAVGKALSSNRLPIVIPCHRVIMKNGKIGGFSAGSGMKQKLLKIEGQKE